MMEIYDNYAKLFKNKKEDSSFYASYETCKITCYINRCPSCGYLTCYFCSNEENCCIRYKIIEMIYKDGFSIISDNIQYNQYKYFDYICIYKLFLIPMFTFFLFIGVIGKQFYHGLHKLKNIRKREYYYIYVIFSVLLVIINALIALMLSINYASIDIYVKIILLIIFLSLKNYPIKFYLGIIKRV